MKKIMAGLALAVVIVLTGCSANVPSGTANEPTYEGDGVYVKVVQLPDDTTVDCVAYFGRAITCDWENRS